MKLKSIAVLVLLVLSASSLRAQGLILVESFTNTDCAPCKTQDQSLEPYLTNKPNVILIYVHSNTPSPTDPFYKASKASSDERFKVFWNPGANPWAAVNGINSSTDFATWRSAIESADANYPVTIAFSTSPFIAGKSTMNVTLIGNASTTSRLNVALVEENIPYHNTQHYGDPVGGGNWKHVLRQILPTPQGTPTFTFSGTKQFDITIDTTGTGWNVQNMHAVAWVENYPGNGGTSDAPVIGLNQFDLAKAAVAAAPVEPLSFDPVTPNPTSGSATLRMQLKNEAHVTVSLVNELGVETNVVRDAQYHAGMAELPISMEQLPAGVYQLRVLVNGVVAQSQKVVRY